MRRLGILQSSKFIREQNLMSRVGLAIKRIKQSWLGTAILWNIADTITGFFTDSQTLGFLSQRNLMTKQGGRNLVVL